MKQMIQQQENAQNAQQLLNRNLDALAATSNLESTLNNLTETMADLKEATRLGGSSDRSAQLKIHRPQISDDQLDLARNLYQARTLRKSA
ncbi:MAG: hypothetical protein AAGA30_15660, partial [Planctomycetota bacterium]